MNNRQEGSDPRVKDFFNQGRESLRLESPLQEVGFLKKIKADASGRVFSNLQVWDHRENRELSGLSSDEKQAWLSERFKRGVACVIFSDGLPVPEEVSGPARHYRVAIFRTPLPKKQCVEGMREILFDFFPNQIVVSGGLLQIFELGVLITGDSGVVRLEVMLGSNRSGSVFETSANVRIGQTMVLGSTQPDSRTGTIILTVRPEIVGN